MLLISHIKQTLLYNFINPWPLEEIILFKCLILIYWKEMLFYLQSMIMFYIKVLFFFDKNTLSVSSVHFTFITSITKLIGLCYTSCISFGFAVLFYSRGLKNCLQSFSTCSKHLSFILRYHL